MNSQNQIFSFLFVMLLVILPIISYLDADISLVKAFAAGPDGAVHNPDFSFAVTGDFGCSDEARKTVSNIKSKYPDLVLVTGDLSYQRNATCWYNTVTPLDINGKLKVALGEHDIDENLTKYHDYMKHFNMTKPFYSFDFGNVHFLVMATAKNEVVPYLNGSEQYNFVKKDLKQAHRNPSIDWIIVNTFRPLYSSNTTHPGLDKLQDIYHPLFEKYGVDIVLQGHNHNYQRTYPLAYNSSKAYTPIVTDRHTRDYDNNPKGQIFFTVGTAGEDLYNFTGQAPYVITQFLHHGFLNLTATFYENRDMKDKDHFSFVKMHNPKKL